MYRLVLSLVMVLLLQSVSSAAWIYSDVWKKSIWHPFNGTLQPPENAVQELSFRAPSRPAPSVSLVCRPACASGQPVFKAPGAVSTSTWTTPASSGRQVQFNVTGNPDASALVIPRTTWNGIMGNLVKVNDDLTFVSRANAYQFRVTDYRRDYGGNISSINMYWSGKTSLR